MQKTLGDLKRDLAKISEKFSDNALVELLCPEDKSVGHLTDVFEQFGIIFLESK